MSLEQKFSKDLAPDLRDETAKKIKAVRARSLEEEIIKRKQRESAPGELWQELKRIKQELLSKLITTDQARETEAFIAESFQARKAYDIEQIQREYQEKFKEIMAKCPLSEAEREEYLSTENLEQMPLADYLTLLSRLSGEAFYHSVKYGAREGHSVTNRFNHLEKEGQFIDNLRPILTDGKIRSLLSTIITDEEEVKRIINPSLVKILKESGSSLTEATDTLLGSYYNTNHPIDRESVHMSYGQDLHNFYGGEKNYPIYFYYPIEYILQNDFFQANRARGIKIGAGHFKNQRDLNMPHNDFAIFNFGEGVPINAGLLCIDGEVRVDPKTGSQYMLEAGQPKIGLDGEYVKATETIRAKEYWEQYFELHPELKPSKVIYEAFSTYAKQESESLKEWAKTKEIFQQDIEKRKEFAEHTEKDREALREIIRRAIKPEFEGE